MKELSKFERYKINRKGQVFSTITKKFLKPALNNNGYKIYCLMKEGRKVMVLRSRLLWEAFKGPIPEGMTINHKNLNKTDDRLSNFEILSIGDNVRHYIRARKRENV